MSASEHAARRLPKSHRALLERSGDEGGAGEQIWFGEAGFLVPRGGADGAEALAELRWPGMHPDLLPFAADGSGNRFCFYVGGGRGLEECAIVYWMYETYRALPIAGSFDRFLEWVGMMAEVSARRGVDQVLDRDHFDDVVSPLLAQLGLRESFAGYFLGGLPNAQDLHETIVDLDGAAAASHLVLASFEQGEERYDRAANHCAEALVAFPDLAVAYYQQSLIHEATGESQLSHMELVRTLHAPLVFDGDEMMPYFSDVPEIPLERVLESVALGGPFSSDLIDEPLWDCILSVEATETRSWLEAAAAYADQGDLELAKNFATNALHMSIGSHDEMLVALDVLENFYLAVGESWQSRAIARERQLVLGQGS